MGGRRPCRFFKAGNCTKGDACTFAHDANPNFKRRACQYFAKGNCHHGSNCSFSHEAEDIEFYKTTIGASASSDSTTSESQLREWRNKLRFGSLLARPQYFARPLRPTMADFYKQALELVSGEAGLMQETIKLLTGEDGLQRITELVDQDFSMLDYTQMSRVFDNQLLPFFKTITHKNVARSIILNSRLMTIYNVLYNSDGDRATELFGAVSKHLQRRSAEMSNSLYIEAIESSLSAFEKLIETNTAAQVHEGLMLVAESMARLFESDFSESVAFAMKPAQRHLRRIEQRLDLGQALPNMDNIDLATGHRAFFELEREKPGKLSEDGPRHDNDNLDIREISIMPTLGEIQSFRPEYLPLADPREWHVGGMEGLLDRHFRLLREDTVGQLRDTARLELLRLQSQGNSDQHRRQGTRTYVYHDVSLAYVAFDKHVGMEFVLGFDQPKGLKSGRNSSERQEWWQSSKRMGHEAVICLLSSEGLAVFFVVVPEPVKVKRDGEPEKATAPLHKDYNLWSHPSRAHVVVRPVNQDDIQALLDRYLNDKDERKNRDEQLSLVEFPGVLLSAFKPTLEALQQMSKSLDVPFTPILAPVSTPANPDRRFDVLPPEYATKPGFRFRLSNITEAGVDLHLTPGENLDTVSAELAACSTLDHGQALALVSSLSRSLALIQGPPGTGKSYTSVQLIKSLLDNKAAGDLGPIICVCFTNHALDQSLERLLDDGIRQIVRIGSQSKSERLQDVNLRSIAQRLDLTPMENAERRSLNNQIHDQAAMINRITTEMSQLGTEESIKNHLESCHPMHYYQLYCGVDEDGFRRVNRRHSAIVAQWLMSAPSHDSKSRSVKELCHENVFSMTRQERNLLYQHWVHEMDEDLKLQLRAALDTYNTIREVLDNIRTELDLRVLRQADIIGITTSGLARNLQLLRHIDSKVLVCEEAGEVLESHLLTALLPSIEHAILIGDHQQLRPHVQNYELSVDCKNGRQYALDMSLFERLAQPHDSMTEPLPLCTLDVQRRMHPLISQLVRQTQYPHLQDAVSVSQFPNVVGMRRRLFWMHHEHKESEADDAVSTSHTNDYEVELTAALVKHLVRQGVYRPDDIAVITPYLGQLRKIRRKLAGTFEIMLNERDVDGLHKQDDDADDELLSAELRQNRDSTRRGTIVQALRIATVDNFQGEEAKVIVVSLVRSNDKNNPGFLRTPNRINVLLSRARHGMYIFGNAKTTEHVKMWADVLQIFHENDNFGDALELCCPRHKETSIVVQKPDDFILLAPEAGCSLPCDKQLPCGHACVGKCHSDMLHNAVPCMKPCTRPKAGCMHNCPLPCGVACDKTCRELVSNIDVKLPCGHRKTSLLCYQHQYPEIVVCDVSITWTVPGCEHKVRGPCHLDVYDDAYVCREPCGALLTCGHVCKQPCYTCLTREDGIIMATEHGQCQEPCNRNYTTCQHRCQSSCHGDEPCPLCEAECEVRCCHSACNKKCYEPCAPCAEETCNSHCPHSQCKMPCAAPCDWCPCSERCTKLLDCGCQCPSVCGETCPEATLCQNHASDSVRSMQADLVLFETYENIDLDDDPCIFTACGHIFTVSTMDGIMDMPTHYEIDTTTGKCVGIKTKSEPFSSDKLKSCPTCRGSLRNIGRYGRIVRRALLDESVKKLTAWSNSRHRVLASRLITEQDHLLATTGVQPTTHNVVLRGHIHEQLKKVNSVKLGRYWPILALRSEVQLFAERLSSDEQPYERVRDLVETTRRHNPECGIGAFEVASSELQLHGHSQAKSLLLRTDIVILSDFIHLHKKTTSDARKGILEVELSSNRNRCDHLANEARDNKSIRQEVEGYVFWARFAAMECGTLDMYAEDGESRMETIKAEALSRLAAAEEICDKFADNDEVNPTKGLKDDIVKTRKMLDEGISSSEMRMVVKVMAREFTSTGHWYRCANGHPFTVGDCGRPMQLACCPACGASIGGQSHVPAEGVQEAADIERRFANITI